jgi:putative flavoprotein involved in K+ transport
MRVANVIWCTGYRPASRGRPPVLGDRQEPETERGVVTQEPELYFIGLEFTYAATSATITGVGRDAKRVAKHIARHRRPAAVGARELAATR